MTAFAEVIGDPVAHSLSPVIHGFWLERLGLDGRYGATRVEADGLADYLAERRIDPQWRGCNVTAPLKERILPLLDRVEAEALRVGAVNCVHRRGSDLRGANTDLAGIAEALDTLAPAGKRIAIIGAGGAARAAIRYCVSARTGPVLLLARSPERAQALTALGDATTPVSILPMAEAPRGLAGIEGIVNASPAGMAHADPVPRPILDALGEAASGAFLFDMVYKPLDTPLLAAARLAGMTAVDGLRMLVGQARGAFALFFGKAPPADGDEALRRRLVAAGI